jgi:hypothetical protein
MVMGGAVRTIDESPFPYPTFRLPEIELRIYVVCPHHTVIPGPPALNSSHQPHERTGLLRNFTTADLESAGERTTRSRDTEK